MPSINEIVQVQISVSSSALTRKGFNSLMIGASQVDLPSFAVGEVRPYTSLKQMQEDNDVDATKPAYKMASIAFSQQPAVPTVYLGCLAADDTSLSGGEVAALRQDNDDWFGYVSTFNNPADIALQEADMGKDKYGFYLVEGATSGLTGYNTLTAYSSLWHTKSTDADAKYVNVGIASRILSRIPGSYTAAFKSLQGVELSKYTAQEELELRPTGASPSHRINQYSSTAGRGITWEGVTADVATKGYIDTYIGVAYLQARITEDVFAVLAAVDKVPYTNAGVSMITSPIEARLSQSVSEGFLKGVPAPIVTAPEVFDITAADRANRLLPDVKFEAFTAGAVHSVKIDGTLII